MFRRNRQERKSFFHGLIFGAGLMLVLILSWQGLGAFFIAPGIPPKAAPDFALMAQAWDTILVKYVDRAAIKPREMTYGAIAGMVESLGDTGHSAFLSPQMLKEQKEFTSGSYKGIGVEVEMKDGHVAIVAPFDGSPAQKAGLRPGEIILKVDGKDIVGIPLFQVVRRIAGEAGTRVTLTIFSPGSGNTREVTLTRATISMHNVTWRRLPGTDLAHLRLAGFSDGVTGELRTALESIKDAGLVGIVLDLRDNPGGLLTEAVGVASQFLKGGMVLQEKDARGNITDVPVRPGGIAPDIPMVILINAGTGSAAEILAGALQDAGRAELIGETTFGTGTVLQQFPLSDGSALLLAIQEWLTPKGRVIWHHGIAPNRTVALPKGTRPLFPLFEQAITPSELRESKDRQLLAALKALKAENH